jgi:hypothetical protein
MTASTVACSLEDDGKVGVRFGNVDDLANPIRDVKRIEGDTNPSRNTGPDFVYLFAKCSGIVMSAASKLNMIPSIQHGADETRLYSASSCRQP